MSFYKRISATITAGIDQFVGLVENHDAVVAASLDDARRQLSRSRVSLARVQQDGEQLRRELDEQRAAEQRWGERALVCGADEARALECLDRRRQVRQRIAELERELPRQRDWENRLSREVQATERQLQDFQQQRNRMRTREAAARALVELREGESVPGDGLSHAFERWEERVLESELALGGGRPPDELDSTFDREERQAELRAELAELRSANQGPHSEELRHDR